MVSRAMYSVAAIGTRRYMVPKGAYCRVQEGVVMVVGRGFRVAGLLILSGVLRVNND